MKKSTPFLTTAAIIAALSAGCAASNPQPVTRVDDRPTSNTQKGAIGGAVAGALIGGIIGNNRGSGNTESGAAIGAVAGGLAGAAIGNVVDRREDKVLTSTDSGYSVRQPPPVPTSEPYDAMPPRPSRDAVWVPGYHSYTGQGDQYQWIAGRWELPPAGAQTWVQPSWQRTSGGDGYVYVRGHWL